MSLLIFLQPFLISLGHIEKQLKASDYQELQIGKIQLENELEGLTFDKIENNKLFFYEEQEKERVTIIFEQYKNMIRKITSKNGHQPIVMGIDSVCFSGDKEVIKWEVTTLEKERYTYFLFPDQ